jgi:squalene-hopene/tetraprenyl-beta-curcumene cyclase
MSPALATATTFCAEVRTRLLGECAGGRWTGELAASALSTAIAVVALYRAGPVADRADIAAGVRWLVAHQNPDGSWGDTVLSRGNLSTTVVVWAALGYAGGGGARLAAARAETWILARAGSLEPAQLARAIEARYGDDRTFAVPIMTLCAIAEKLGDDPWRHVRPLPFELAACPRSWFRFANLQVVSYALPALIAVGQARFRRRPPRNPLTRALRAAAAGRTLRLLTTLQPGSGGFLEAIPLTGFVVMSLAAADALDHPVVARGLAFLRRTRRPDGSWPIDVDLATWLTTGAVNALAAGDGLAALSAAQRDGVRDWLLAQQHRVAHPYTGSPPGGWAWTDLPGGVPDADDTAGALIALHHLDAGNPAVGAAAAAGVTWLMGLQNRDGGMPTFCRGWGALAFDRSAPDLTAHALIALATWRARLPAAQRASCERTIAGGLGYLRRTQRTDGSWVPLWFGNEHEPDERNPTYATARVAQCLVLLAPQGDELRRATAWLLAAQRPDGGWGGGRNSPASIEETGLALDALLAAGCPDARSIAAGMAALRALTTDGTRFPPAPIGFYFANLWYFERLYPLIFSLGAAERHAAQDRCG